VIERIAAAAAVAQRDPEIAVPAEGELATVVVRVRLFEGEDRALAGGVEDPSAALALRGGELGEDGVAVAVGVVDEGPAFVRPAGIEREPQEPLLTAATDPVTDVEDHGRRAARRIERHDAAGALVDEK
jgi:hypothetical protein